MYTTSTPAAAKPASPRRGEGDPITQFAVIVWKGGHAENIQKHWFDEPVDALACAVEYLKKGYQARLTDGTVRYFADLTTDDRPAVGPQTVFLPPGGGA